jgi:hypothetical protein
LDGTFDSTGRIPPAATRLEGLLAALEFLPKDELRDKIEAATDRGVAFLLRAQVVSGPETGGIPGAVISRALDSSEIRIEQTHVLSSRDGQSYSRPSQWAGGKEWERVSSLTNWKWLYRSSLEWILWQSTIRITVS